jgi:hypothetical protein
VAFAARIAFLKVKSSVEIPSSRGSGVFRFQHRADFSGEFRLN